MASKKKNLVAEDGVLDLLLAPQPREAAPAPKASPEPKAPKAKREARPAQPAPASLEAFRVYSLKEVAQVVGVSTRTLMEYIKAGRLRATKIGVRWRVSPDNLRAFINGDGSSKGGTAEAQEAPVAGEVSEKSD